MSLIQKLKEDLRNAIKNRDELKVSVLRFLLSDALNKEKEIQYSEGKRRDLRDDEVEQVIFSQVKKRKDAQEFFKKGKRDDLIEKEKREIEILEKYLPKLFSEKEIENFVKEAIKKVKATSLKDMGKVMKELMPKVKGKADGKMVSEIVRKLLRK